MQHRRLHTAHTRIIRIAGFECSGATALFSRRAPFAAPRFRGVVEARYWTREPLETAGLGWLIRIYVDNIVHISDEVGFWLTINGLDMHINDERLVQRIRLTSHHALF